MCRLYGAGCRNPRVGYLFWTTWKTSASLRMPSPRSTADMYCSPHVHNRPVPSLSASTWSRWSRKREPSSCSAAPNSSEQMLLWKRSRWRSRSKRLPGSWMAYPWHLTRQGPTSRRRAVASTTTWSVTGRDEQSYSINVGARVLITRSRPVQPCPWRWGRWSGPILPLPNYSGSVPSSTLMPSLKRS